MKCEICQEETDDLYKGKCQNCYHLDGDFWEMECVKISVKKELDDLTYAQKKRDEER